MNDDPPQVLVARFFVGPDDGGDGFRASSDACDFPVTTIRVVTLRTVLRIVQACDGQTDHNRQTYVVLRQRFLQHDKSPGVFLLIGQDTAEGHFATERVQRILRLKDGCIDPEHFKLLQIAVAFVPNANQRGRTRFRSGGSDAGLLIALVRSRGVQKRIVRCRGDLQRLPRLHSSERIATTHSPIPSKEKLPDG